MENKVNYFAVGAFTLTLVIGIVCAMLWLFSERSGKHERLYEVYFEGSVSGLREGSPVHYRGVPVGIVRSIGIDEKNVEHVCVRVGIDRDTPIKTDTEASLEMQGLTGLSCIQISGGTNDSLPLEAKKNERYPRIPAKSSRIEQVFASAPEMMVNIATLMAEIQKLFTPENRQAVTALIHNLATLSGTLSDKSTDIKGLVTQLSKTLTVLEKNLHILGSQGEETLLTLNKIMGDNQGSIKNFTGIGLDQLTKLISDLRTSVAGMNRIIDRVERSPSRFLFGDDNGTVKAR